MPIVGYDTENISDEQMAAQMVNDLSLAYPEHPWFVVIRGGIVHIRNMDFPPNWGMCLHYSDIKGDYRIRKKQMISSAGEFLERANIKRGVSEGIMPDRIEGIPEKYMKKIAI